MVEARVSGEAVLLGQPVPVGAMQLTERRRRSSELRLSDELRSGKSGLRRADSRTDSRAD